MSYNKEALPHYMKTAGKISVLAAVAGLAVFLFAFMVDVGQQEFQRVSAQTASTSLTVLNTPPVFTVLPTEVIPSSTTSPTNSGDVIQWTAVGTDSNAAPYFLLVCSTNATPTANEASGPGNLGSAPPDCGIGATQWAVSTSTISGDVAFVATTTAEGVVFAESNDWYAWVCDDDPTEGACNTIPSQGQFGAGASSSSPFNMNNRPTLTNAYNDSPVDPGGLLTFLSTSTDGDVEGSVDTMTIVVCGTAGDYNDVTNDCDSNFIASSSVPATTDVTATTTIGIPVRDQVYDAFVFLVDEHGHEAVANPIQTNFEVANVAPSLTGTDIDLNGGLDMLLTVPGGTTTGFTLDFEISDANSCENAAAGDEIIGFELSVLRSGPSGSYATSTNCDPGAADYNPNGCYTSGLPFDVWQLGCTASSTSCTGPLDETQIFNCTFPLWFLADPTDAGPRTPTAFENDFWIAAVAGADDNFATSSQVASVTTPDVISAPYIDLLTAVIPYGALAPGDNTGTLSTTTTIINIGNTGIDQEVDGSAMCPTFVSTSSDCTLNATSTVFTSNQQFASTSVAYNSPFAQTLPTTTDALPAILELNVLKTTSTSTPETDVTYWGIAVPSAVTIAGSYTGLNTFLGITAQPEDWE
jgi:hypothetical protein